MVEMDSIATANPKDAANNYLLMGNGFYNMSYFGNSRLFYDTKFVEDDSYGYSTTEKSNENEIFYSTAKAKEYYLKAMSASNNKNMQAKCCWLLAKCEQANYYIHGSDIPQKENSDIFVGEYYQKMKTEYSKTKYYKEVIKECGYFAKYVK